MKSPGVLYQELTVDTLYNCVFGVEDAAESVLMLFAGSREEENRMKIYRPDDTKPEWMIESERQMREEVERRDQVINRDAVALARRTMKPTQDLRTRIAEIICNARHGGFDLWSVIEPQSDRAKKWLDWADHLLERDARA